jgi:hypothetical protein
MGRLSHELEMQEQEHGEAIEVAANQRGEE